MKRRLFGLFLAVFLGLSAASVWAGADGLYPTALGARAAGMGGVDLAIATDATALGTNPAGLIQLKHHRIDFGAGLYIPTEHFTNDLNDEDNQPLYLPSPMVAWGFHPKDSAFAGGLGVFTDPGVGASDFSMKNHLLGDEANYYSQIQIMRFIGAIAWAPHPSISLALAPELSLSQMDFDLPYNKPSTWLKGPADTTNKTSFAKVIARPLDEGGLGLDEITFRLRMIQARAYGVGGRFGLLWMPLEQLHIGLIYALQVNMKYYGHARLDMGPQFNEGFDRLAAEYERQGLSAEAAAKAARDQYIFWGLEDGDLESKYDAKMEFSWPQQIGLGIAGNPTEALLLGLDAKWLQWSNTMPHLKMIVKRPNNRNAKHVLGSYKKRTDLPADWDDQFVAAAGAQYEFVKNFWGRLGYNYGNNPVPAESVAPLFPAQVEHHIAAGLGYRYDLFEVNGAYEYGVPNTVKVDGESSWGREYDDSEFTQGSHDAKLMFSFTF